MATATMSPARPVSPNSLGALVTHSHSSIVSSTASFVTAPLSVAHNKTTQEHVTEMHILQLTTASDAMQIRQDPYISSVPKSLRPGYGPPPPSPPASVTRSDIDDDDPDDDHESELRPRLVTSQSEPGLKKERPVIYDEPESIRERQLSIATSTSSSQPGTTFDSLPHSSSETNTNAKSSLRTITLPTSTEPASASTSQHRAQAHLSADGYLQPPPLTMHRPTRRNTTGSNARRPTNILPNPQPSMVEDGEELASDIELHAEQIRRERLSKRVKMQQEAEAFLTRGRPERKETKDDVVLVGNLIGEDHVNYVLMYNMLTGIRIGVSRCQAKMKRPLTDEDFTARHKFSFDIVGNELTPSAKYDFKFKDYAPWVFRSLREDHFHLDPADYLLSLTSKYILSELGSPGKSGSFFYFSRDYRFIIKTIHHSEHKFLLKILPQYYAHVKSNPHTLLSRFYGLHRVKLPRGRKIHFVIMNNLFPPHRDIHETYDLKGSTIGREYSEEKAERNPRAVLKDLNWIKRGKMLELGPEKRALLTEQMRRDKEFLKTVGVMDYSLLVGIHNMQRGNRDNVRRNTLKVFSPDLPPPQRKTTSTGSKSPEAIAVRRAMRNSDPKRLGTPSHSPPSLHSAHAPTSFPRDLQDTFSSTSALANGSSSADALSSGAAAAGGSGPEGGSSGLGEGGDAFPDLDAHFVDRQHFIFYQDEGGLRATDEANEGMGVIYYFGVIDILTPYNMKKKLEHLWKGLQSDRHKISPVPPTEYAERFFEFMKAVMRGGEGGSRFKAE